MMLCCSDPRVTDAMSAEGDKIVARISAFAKTLRANSFTVGARETEDAAKLLSSDIGLKPRFAREALKALFCGNRPEWARFDEIFDAFWLGKGVKSKVTSNLTSAAGQGTDVRQIADRLDPAGGTADLGDQVSATEGEDKDDGTRGVGRMEGASRIESISTTDFRKINDARAMAEAHRLAEQLAKKMRTNLTRRSKVHRRGRRVDFRRTLRRSIQSGGIPLTVVRRRRAEKDLRLIVLLDVSGSMSQYTAMFVRFIHGVLTHFREAEAFLIHTSLAYISPALAERDAARALDRLSLIVQGAGGGTRIGESLAAFNKWHARRVINSRTCVIIVSDGYDTGAPEMLAEEMRRVARRCRRIVWLNPMMGWEGYEPSARGMQAAMPHIAKLLPAYSIASLAAIEPHLTRLR